MACPVEWPEVFPAALPAGACAVLCLATADGDVRRLTFGPADAAATRFRFGSATKLLTALVVRALEREGRLTLDAPLSPDSGVTPRRLLTHTAGLPDEVLPATVEPATVTATNRLPPGKVFSYANPGFAAVGAWLERLTAQPLHALVRRYVLTPYGMATADLDPGPAAAAGGLTGTAEDAARLLLGLLRHPAHLAALLETTVVVPSRPGTAAGLGCFQRRRGDALLVEHEGFTGDEACVVCLVPAEGWGYALLTKGWPQRLRRTLERLEAVWFGPAATDAATAVKPSRVSPTLHARYVGEYVNGPRRLGLIGGADTLYLERGRLRIPLIQYAATRLAVAVPLPDKPSDIVVVLDDAGEAVCLYPFGSLRALRRLTDYSSAEVNRVDSCVGA